MAPLMIVEVALNIPLHKTFDYRWPEALNKPPVPGVRVLVPFGTRKLGGVVTMLKKSSNYEHLKPVEEIIEDHPSFTREILNLAKWVGEYYFCGWGEVLNAAVPGGLAVLVRTEYTKAADSLPDFKTLPAELRFLVESKDKWNLKEWRNSDADHHSHQVLRGWIEQGLVQENHVLLGKKTKPKMQRWVRLLDHQEKPVKKQSRKITKRQQILSLLKNNPEMPWEDIRAVVTNPASALRQMHGEKAIDFYEKRVYRRFLDGPLPELESFNVLTEDQRSVFDSLRRAFSKGAFQTFLLEGVTGSGKTEVYLHAVRAARELDKTCLILVPEISLTPQLINRFRARFGDQVAVLHSGMEDGERYDEWSRVRNGETPIVVGARSAVFAPLKNPGLIIVDEEHDPSYKQADTPRYHGRDVAVYRGFCCNAMVLLGSATPSLESAHNIVSGKYLHLHLKQRIHQEKMPEVQVLDMKHSERQQGSPFFSKNLVEALRERLLRKEQSIVFLNRRGFAPLVICGECNETHTCLNCSLSLVFHRGAGELRCHQCEFVAPMPNRCPFCSTDQKPKVIGIGTEQIESELKMMFPEARLMRMDRDSIHGRHTYSRMQERIHRHEVDIVIGTQMVAKGHDFPKVTLVGVVLADLSLNIPDFRAGERTFQLLTQVAGRAGRADKPGEVLVQTYNPRHHSLRCTRMHDAERFRELELRQRKNLAAPPFLNLALLLFSSPDENRAERLAHQHASLMNPLPQSVRLIGPMEAPVKKIRNRFRRQILLKSARVHDLHSVLKRAAENGPRLRRDELLQIDVDPHHLI